MKYLLFIFIFFFIAVSCTNKQKNINQENKIKHDSIVQIDTGYNEKLAKKLGADDYGMKIYIMAFLKRGDNPSNDSVERAKLQRAHLDNINRLAKQGILVVAGPFLDDGDIRGIYIFNVSTIKEARKLTESDPAIQVGALKMELHKWYGSAALIELNKLHTRIAKTNI